jgi:integrase
MPAQKLTDKLVHELEQPESGNRITYDTEVKGFGIRVTTRGARSYVLTYWNREGRQRRITIGSAVHWKTGAARTEAKELKKRIDRGEDPLQEEQDLRAAPTVKDMCERFTKEYLGKRRASTQYSYRTQITSVILPAWGNRKVASITHGDVVSLHNKLGDTPTRANRILALLSRLFTLSITWGWRTTNPCAGVERNEENHRDRYLADDELPRFLAALDRIQDRQAADVIRLLLYTGARRGETLQARWDDIDLKRKTWSKPGATTKRKTTHHVPLSDEACRLLARIKAGSPARAEYVFPANGGHRKDVREAFEQLCRLAGIEGFRLHDLRHSYASVLINSGLGLPVIGGLLGHTTPATTARYAHLQDKMLREAAERAAATISGEKA